MIRRLLSLGLAALATGCASYVKTYNSSGDLQAVCKHGTEIFGLTFLPFGVGGHCSGSANPKDQ